MAALARRNSAQMARIDRLREEIGWLKGPRRAAVIGVVVAHVNHLAYRRIEELENA
jgi:peptidoglycan/LPS O-acetylase OafA/YrhL